GVAVGEALERLPQVGMRVEVEDAHSGEALGVGPDGAEGHGVIAAEHAGDLPAIEPALGLGVDPVVERRADRVDALDAPRALGVVDALLVQRAGEGNGLAVPRL